VRTFRVREADLVRLDWDALRGVHTALDLGELTVHIEWDWLGPEHDQTRTDPRREPAVAV
jgi:hypothetical protein